MPKRNNSLIKGGVTGFQGGSIELDLKNVGPSATPTIINGGSEIIQSPTSSVPAPV